jgi:hypothetical protein
LVKLFPGLSASIRTSMIALYCTYARWKLSLERNFRIRCAASCAAVGLDSAASTMTGRCSTSSPSRLNVNRSVHAQKAGQSIPSYLDLRIRRKVSRNMINRLILPTRLHPYTYHTSGNIGFRGVARRDGVIA